MLRNSFLIVCIQILGIILSFASLYFIAGDMEPEVYSLVGTYAVILGVVNTFSHLGIETTMTREALFWMEKGDIEKVKEYATQALCSRLFGFVVLSPILVGYVIYLNFSKYNNDRSILLVMFLVGSLVSTLNDALSVIIRSKGGYVLSQMARTLNQSVVKCIGLGLYFAFGANVYLYYYSLSSIPLLVFLLIYVGNLLSVRYILFKQMIEKIKEAKYLWLRLDMEYFKNYADSLLVSIVFPSYIMGAYSIYKQLEGIAKDFIEGFFDVLSQNTVKYKTNYKKLCEEERKFNIVRIAIMLVVCIGTFIFWCYSDVIISTCRLTKYVYIDYMIYCTAVVSLVYLSGKYETNAIAFFGSSRMNFQISLFLFFVAIVAFGIILILPNISGALLQRIIVYAAMSIISIILFRRNRRTLYENILN